VFVLRNDYDNQVCSLARALEVVGERWTLLIVRDVFLGVRRFDELQADLGIARNVLQTRLERLVEHGVLEKRPYQERPLRHEYRLTEKGVDLWPTIVSLLHWGDRYAPAPKGAPVLITHKDCGGELDDHRICTRCGQSVEARQARAVPGPGVPAGHPLLRPAA
jgi:DNA-binding HxlR family transcriptional regulator